MRYLNIPGSPPVSTWPSGPYLGMFRLYDPSNGVWMSQDPLGYVDGGNRNAYVGQNPLSFIDPLGLNARDTRGAQAEHMTSKPTSGKQQGTPSPTNFTIPGAKQLAGVFMGIGAGADKTEERRRFARMVYPNADEAYIRHIASGGAVVGAPTDPAELAALAQSLTPDPAGITRYLSDYALRTQEAAGLSMPMIDPTSLPSYNLNTRFFPRLWQAVRPVSEFATLSGSAMGGGGTTARYLNVGPQTGSIPVYGEGISALGKNISGGVALGMEWYTGADSTLNANTYAGGSMGITIPIGPYVSIPISFSLTQNGTLFGIALQFGLPYDDTIKYLAAILVLDKSADFDEKAVLWAFATNNHNIISMAANVFL